MNRREFRGRMRQTHLSSKNSRKPSRGRKVQYVLELSSRVLIGKRIKYYFTDDNRDFTTKTFVKVGGRETKVKCNRRIEKNVYRYEPRKIVNKIIHR